MAKAGRPRLTPEQKAVREELRKEKRKQAKWVSAVNALPDQASPSAELNWIRNHPAMSRLDRIKDRTKTTRIILEVGDISPTHGTAPSKAAVSMLQHWCNRPDEFYKNLLAEQKKATKVDSDGGIVDDVENSAEVKNIDALIASIAQAVEDMELVDE